MAVMSLGIFVMLASTGRIVSLLELGEFDAWTVLVVTIVLICSVVITWCGRTNHLQSLLSISSPFLGLHIS